MASKAGRVQFKDIKVGKTFWMVRGGYSREAVAADAAIVSVWPEPDRIVITQRPFRSQIEDTDGLRDEWTFQAKTWYDEVIHLDCNMFGIKTDVSWTPRHPTVDFLFTTRKAALRYSDRMRHSHNYRVAFEHPCQWTKTKLRKRVGSLYNGVPTIYGDFPTRTNSHRPWLWTAPLETLLGGIVIGPHVSKERQHRLWELTRDEVNHMYPYVIEPINLPAKVDLRDQLPPVGDQGDLSASSAFAVMDAIVGYDPAGPASAEMSVARDSEGKIHVTHVVIGNGDKITHSAGKTIVSRGIDRHLRSLHRQVAVVPKSATEDPVQRAQLERDFVIIDEVHPLDALNNLKKITAQGSFEKLAYTEPQAKKED
jgi:hypothetical protein